MRNMNIIVYSGDMPAATMFSKFKSGAATPQNPYDNNPIAELYEIGKQAACAGPELVWKIHDGIRKSDKQVSSTFYSFQFFFLWILVVWHR